MILANCRRSICVFLKIGGYPKPHRFPYIKHDCPHHFLQNLDFMVICDDTHLTSLNWPWERYFFRVLLEKLNSSMCAMCFPVGPKTPDRGGMAWMFWPKLHCQDDNMYMYNYVWIFIYLFIHSFILYIYTQLHAYTCHMIIYIYILYCIHCLHVYIVYIYIYICHMCFLT